MTDPRDPAGEQARLRQDEAIRARQRSRAKVTALLLFALVLLFYALSIAKMVK
ncbi:hypothetical protein [Sphingomonas morindae]|uniref:Protoheme IX farnesyltransferase n=1 Tax=Sphingomonas morindae TaxID=1541170 RepID=A0ABY4XCD9_9SPHN|nr:hypothetical protein [Sphingomonas morindae]USI74638.1 hypothetical protein LHA26_10865 [Sphingomonas morindae]